MITPALGMFLKMSQRLNSTNMAMRSENSFCVFLCMFFSVDLVSWNMMELSSISESLHTKYDSY